MSLREAYDAAAAVLREHSGVPDTDSFDVVQEVESLREYWRPDKPCVVLLAESHVSTQERDFGFKLNEQILQRHGLVDYPLHFVRFVYCLGAGERELLHAGAASRNRSKWQFWRLLWSCENDPSLRLFDLTRRATPNFDKRLEKKVRLLKTLQGRGIWLIDASIIGINGLELRVKREAMTISWERYVGPRIEALHQKPRRMIVIGAAVAEAVFQSNSREGTWSGIPYAVVNQPQGDRSRESTLRTLTEIYRTCSMCGGQP